MNFQPIEKENKSQYESAYRAACRMGADASFTTPYAWAESFQTKLCIENNAVLMEGTSHTGEHFFMLPLYTPESEALLKRLYAFCHDTNRPFILRWLQKEDLPILERCFPGRLSIESNRNAAEYIYETESLLTLSGKKLHAKRNHFNAFTAAYAYEIEPLSPARLPEAREFVLARCQTEEEKKAMERLFHVYTDFSLVGMLLYVDKTLVAVTIGEDIGFDTAVIHVEKADTAYTGVYAAVNRLFIQNFFAHTRYINREEDMGIAGLRKAKLSYHPAFLLEKFTATEVLPCK